MTIHRTPVTAITLGVPGTTSTIDRIAAGAAIVFTWPGEGTPERAFLGKAIRWADDATITVGELYNLVYGVQNPILTVGEDDRAIVTQEAHGSPYWKLLNELIDRKRAALGHLDLEAACKRFSMPVSEAALKLGITPSAVRQLISRSRLVARQEGGSYLLDPDSVEAYAGIRRGPKPIAQAAAELTTSSTPPEEEEPRPRSEARIGHSPSAHVRLKGVRLENAVATNNITVGYLPAGWTRAYLLSYRADGRARFIVLEPSDNPDEGWSFRGFHVTGAKIVETENRPKEARARFESIPTIPKTSAGQVHEPTT